MRYALLFEKITVPSKNFVTLQVAEPQDQTGMGGAVSSRQIFSSDDLETLSSN